MNMKPLTEFCTLNMGQSPDSKTYNDHRNGIPFYQGNADFGEIHPKTRVWCSAPVKIAEDGDILISVRAPIGAMNMAVKRCCIGRGLAALTPIHEKCGKQFLYYALQSKVDSLIAQGTGSTFKAISKKVLEATLIPAYSINEQEQITETISHVDRAIAARRSQLALLDQLVKSRFIELFGDPEFNTMNWSIAKLSTICDVGSSKRIYQSELKNDGVPFLRISDLNERIDGEVNTPQLFIPMEKFDELKANGLVPVSGDILVTSRGTLGRCYIVKDGDNFYFQDGMISWLSGIDQRILNLFLSHLFSTTGVQKQIMNLQAGSTVAYLSIAMLKQLDIILPPMELQEQFAAFVEQTDKSKLAIQASLDKLEILKKSLMQQYFG